MSDDTLTGARLVEAMARVLCPTGQTSFGACAPACGHCDRQARAALRAQAEAAGVTAQGLHEAADDTEETGHDTADPQQIAVADLLRALAEVLRDE